MPFDFAPFKDPYSDPPLQTAWEKTKHELLATGTVAAITGLEASQYLFVSLGDEKHVASMAGVTATAFTLTTYALGLRAASLLKTIPITQYSSKGILLRSAWQLVNQEVGRAITLTGISSLAISSAILSAVTTTNGALTMATALVGTGMGWKVIRDGVKIRKTLGNILTPD